MVITGSESHVLTQNLWFEAIYRRILWKRKFCEIGWKIPRMSFCQRCLHLTNQIKLWARARAKREIWVVECSSLSSLLCPGKKLLPCIFPGWGKFPAVSWILSLLGGEHSRLSQFNPRSEAFWAIMCSSSHRCGLNLLQWSLQYTSYNFVQLDLRQTDKIDFKPFFSWGTL